MKPSHYANHLVAAVPMSKKNSGDSHTSNEAHILRESHVLSLQNSVTKKKSHSLSKMLVVGPDGETLKYLLKSPDGDHKLVPSGHKST